MQIKKSLVSSVLAGIIAIETLPCSAAMITARATKNHAIDKRCHWESIGVCSSVEQKMFPDLNDIFDLNLKTFDYDNDYHRDIVRKYNLNICH